MAIYYNKYSTVGQYTNKYLEWFTHYVIRTGNISTHSLQLVTDRVIEDVQAKNLKGTYNALTLNRVEWATGYVANRLTENGYPTSVETKITWAVDRPENFRTDEERINNFPTAEEMQRYLGNVALCLRQFCKKSTTGDLPESIDGLNYIGANTIEQVLEDIDELLYNMIASWRYSGTFYAGEDGP